MGNYNSGRARVRTWVAECLAVDVRWLARNGFLSPGAAGRLSWTRWNAFAQSEDEIGSIGVTALLGSEMTILFYWSVAARGSYADARVRVRIVRTPGTLGGTRRWFACPRCGGRVAKLYVQGVEMLCRICARLVYSSQQQGAYDRLLDRVASIRRKLGAQPGMMSPPPIKPKHMHWKTFSGHMERLRLAEDEASRHFIERGKKFLGWS